MISSSSKNYYLYLAKYKNKNLELKVINNILSAKNSILEDRKRVLKEKYQELDNVNCNVWDTEDKFCNEIWNFSSQHNFVFFNQYPCIMENNRYHECKYSSISNENTKKTDDVHKKTTLAKLKHEIDHMNNEITFICNQSVEQEIEDSKFTLNNLQLFTEEISEIIRLLNTSENFMNTSNNISAYQGSNTCMHKEFVSAKKLFKKSTVHTGILIERSITTISNTIIERSNDTPSNNASKDNSSVVKFGKFIMKKQSIISLKHQQTLTNLK